jgi:signal transduction histidine kinase
MAAERSLRRQVAATISLAILGVMALAMVLAVLLLQRTVVQRFDARLMAAASELQGAVARSADGGIALDADVPSDPFFADRASGWGWVVREGQRVLARSRSLAAGPERAELPLGGLAEVQPGEAGGRAWRAVTVRIRGDDGLSATVAMPRDAVRSEVMVDAALVLPAIAGLALLLVAVAWSQASRALQPVAVLAEDLERLKVGATPALPKTRFRELNAVVGLINDLADERRSAHDDARDRAARLAHGLKTPLAVLSARFGESGSTPDPKVVAAVDGMNRMIRLNLAEARAGRTSAIRPEPIALAPIIDDLSAAFRHTLGRPDLMVANDVPGGFTIPLSADDAHELMGNLLENAFRHARSEVVVSVAGENTLAIVNDGAGFPDEVLLAFARPSGGEAEPSAAAMNGGLGLAIASRISHRHGGAMTISNEPGPRAAVAITFQR